MSNENSRSALMSDFSKYEGILCEYHFIPERKDKERLIKKVLSNAVKTSGGHLDIPQASLVEYKANRGTFNIYEAGERELTKEEKGLLDEMRSLCTPEELEYDLISDGSMCYWRERAFRESKKVDGISMERWYHERLMYSTDRERLVRDPKIKGKLLYTFKFYGKKD